MSERILFSLCASIIPEELNAGEKDQTEGDRDGEPERRLDALEQPDHSECNCSTGSDQ